MSANKIAIFETETTFFGSKWKDNKEIPGTAVDTQHSRDYRLYPYSNSDISINGQNFFNIYISHSSHLGGMIGNT